MSVTLDAIRNCFDGAVPAVIATCAPDGAPNVAYLSQVHFVDNAHVALSFQFFNKTRENVLANPYAKVQVVDPDTAAQYRLALRYERTETDGPLFEHMKAKLAGIASHTGMSKVFRLLGSDVYRVLEIECVPGPALPCRVSQPGRLTALRGCTQRLGGASDLATLIDDALACLEERFQMCHSMLLILDESGRSLYTVATRGYAESGVGSEIRLGEGIIGVAAEQRTAIRISHMAVEYLYSRAVRRAVSHENGNGEFETEIPLPGLSQSHSQLAVPVLWDAQLLGVLYVESPQERRFTYEDEDALSILAQQLAWIIHAANQSGEHPEEGAVGEEGEERAHGKPLVVRHFSENDSVFINNDYVIKGVAGAILWKLLRDYVHKQRTEFTNRELRLDPDIPLPDISANLEARLILLQRRLAERCPKLRIEKVGRGRFRLDVQRPVELQGN